MFRPLTKTISRPNPLLTTAATAATRSMLNHNAHLRSRSLFTSATAPKRSMFKSTILRWITAGGLVYFYSTSTVFADDPKFYDERLSTPDDDEEERPRSLIKGLVDGEEEMVDVEKEQGQEAAFNPETGEINWDCPCLGGMANGPCGEEFKTAFSCFVFSGADPKGVDCIDKFKGMQTCFQKYPEIYGDEAETDPENPNGKPEEDEIPEPKNPEHTGSSMKASGENVVDTNRVDHHVETTKIESLENKDTIVLEKDQTDACNDELN